VRNCDLRPVLKADFEADLTAHARLELQREWGAEAGAIENSNVLIYFFEAQRKRIAARPRRVDLADDFACPSLHQAGWNSLQEKVRKGEDINPHMSKSHASLMNRDGLLNEWSVYHIHLGEGPDRRDPNYIERTGPVVFALVTADTFLAINVYPHGAWNEATIIESLHRNWPGVISRYRLNGVAGKQLSAADRGRIRRAGGQSAVAVSDGTVYGSIGGPVSSTGTKYDSVAHADACSASVRQLQSALANDVSAVIPALQKAGYVNEEEIEARLQIVNGRFLVFFLKYDVWVDLDIVPANAL